MKKIRILSIILALVMIVGMLTGCNEVSKKDIEANPSVSISEALKKSFAKSPFGGLLELKDPQATSFNLNVDVDDEEVETVKLGAIVANDGSGMLLDVLATVSGESFAGQLFIDGSNFAVKMKELKDIFGTDAVGVKLDNFEKTFKESAWYDLLVVQTGAESEFEMEGLDDVDFGAIVDSYEKYLNEVKTIADECQKFQVNETKITNGKKKIDCFEVVQTYDDATVDKFINAIKTFIKDVAKATGVPEDEFDVDDIDEMKDLLKKAVSSYKTTYTIDKKTGAALKINSALNLEIESDIIYENDWEDGGIVEKYNYGYECSVDFGTDPTNTFAPSFDLKIYEDDMTTTFKGSSTIDTSKKAFVLDMVFEEKCDDEDMAEWYDTTINAKFILNQDGKYQMVLSDGDDEIKFGGTFKVEGSKLTFVIETSKVEEANMGDVEIIIDFNASKPQAFEYENLLAWDEEKIEDLLETFGAMNDYNDPYLEDELIVIE